MSEPREVIGALRSEVEFEAAVADLGTAGMHRARISFPAQDEIAASCASAVGCGIKQLPRVEIGLSDDRQQVRTLGTAHSMGASPTELGLYAGHKPVRNAQTERIADMTTNVEELPNGEQDDPAVRNSVATFAAKINQLLADALSIYLKTKNFHWHVSGPHFRDYHLMLDEQASGILDAIDPLAERVRAAGSTTIRSLGQAAQLRTIADKNADHVAPDAMLAELMEDKKALGTSMRQVHKLCDELDDVATASLLEGYIEAAEKRAWFLRQAAQPR